MSKIIVGNWKMFPTLSDSVVLATSLKRDLEELGGVEVVLAPPTAWLLQIVESWKHRAKNIHFAAQNVWAEDQGAFTGEVSAYMVKDLVDYAIIGHSERRHYQGEDDDLIHQKLQACLRWGITPILCVGENKKTATQEGQLDKAALEKILEQLTEGLGAIAKENLPKVIIAYEPVWAIGTGQNATPAYVESIVKELRRALSGPFGSAGAELRFLYGGSVSRQNAGDYLRLKEIDGLLAGTVSVKAKEFKEICQIASRLRD